MKAIIKTALKVHQKAAEALMKTIKKEYPVGSIQSVELGGNILTIEISGHSRSWYYDPSRLFGTNIHTTKFRNFDVEDIRGG